MPQDITIRDVREEELAQLLELYRHLHADDSPLPAEDRLLELWKSICHNDNLIYLAAEVDGRLVSSCTLAIVPNLTRGARPYAVVENVVTHREYRCRGLGTAVLRAAVERARGRGCYKVMLLTGSKQESTLRFYERAGFRRGVKTGFLLSLKDGEVHE
jgi:ribosomal protein S18 acetylase RimI-like enzyme